MQATQKLLDATKAVAARDAFRGVDKTRLGLAQDIQQRASELLEVHAGYEFTPAQVEYLQCLRQRLQDFCIASFVCAQEWEDAFCDAYQQGGK
jgi:hypothetical protein